jgi:hypothetical protein
MDALSPVGSRWTSQPWRASTNVGEVPAPPLHVDGGIDVRAHLLPPLAVLKTTAFPPAQSLAVTHPCSGSRKDACSSASSGGSPPGTVCIGVMSVHVLPKSSVARRRWRHLDGCVARQRRTVTTPNDLDASWNVSTLVVRAPQPEDDETGGAELEAGVDECAGRLGSSGEGVHEAAISAAATNGPARRIIGGTGNSSRPADSSARGGGALAVEPAGSLRPGHIGKPGGAK